MDDKATKTKDTLSHTHTEGQAGGHKNRLFHIGSWKGGRRQRESRRDFDPRPPARDSPYANTFRHAFGMSCQSTIWNQTEEVVHVIISDRIIPRVETEGNINISPKSADIGKKAAIPPHKSLTFNLDSSYYYLTFYTLDEKGKTRRMRLHQINLKVRRTNDYVILPEYLELYVGQREGEEPHLAQEIMYSL